MIVSSARLPRLLERLRGTAARIEKKVSGVSDLDVRRRIDGTWSAPQHIGHLLDLEELHLARLDELAAGAPVLSAADPENRRTWQANHNATPLPQPRAAFRASRAHPVSRIETWDVRLLEARSLHPSPHMPMRLVDMAFIIAEHDDYHLARMHERLHEAGITSWQ